MELSQIRRVLKPIIPLRGMLYLKHNQTSRPTRHTSIDFGIELTSAAEEAVFEMDGVRHTMRFPWVSTRMPGHVYQMFTPRPWEVIAFTYDAEHLSFFQDHGLDPELPGWAFTMTPRISALAAEVREQYESIMMPGAADRLDSLALEFLMECLLNHRLAEQRQCGDHDRIQRIASYLRLHLHADIDLDEVLKKHHISRRTFFRHWNKYMDMPPNVFLQDCRIGRACELLRQTDLCLYEIAGQTGFRDSTYLCAAFRRAKEQSPTAYRKSCRGTSFSGRVPATVLRPV